MPTGTYDIENFLVEKLKTIGVEISEEDKSYILVQLDILLVLIQEV